MSTHEFTVFPYHLSFLKEFPEINSWLNCHGFSVLHSHLDLKTQTICSFWDDHSSAAEKSGINDGKHSLMIVYGQVDKTVEVFHRMIIATGENEKLLVNELDCLYGNPIEDEDGTELDTDIFSSECADFEIEDLLDGAQHL